MAHRQRIPVTLTLDADLLDQLDALRAEHGTPVSRMVDLAIREWLARRGLVPTPPPARPRQRPRRRS